MCIVHKRNTLIISLFLHILSLRRSTSNSKCENFDLNKIYLCNREEKKWSRESKAKLNAFFQNRTEKMNSFFCIWTATSNTLCHSNGECETSRIYRKHVRSNLITNSQAIQFILISLWQCTNSVCNCFSASLAQHSWDLTERQREGERSEMHGVAVSSVSWQEVRSCRSNCHTITAFITHQHANKGIHIYIISI